MQFDCSSSTFATKTQNRNRISLKRLKEYFVIRVDYNPESIIHTITVTKERQLHKTKLGASTILLVNNVVTRRHKCAINFIGFFHYKEYLFRLRQSVGKL